MTFRGKHPVRTKIDNQSAKQVLHFKKCLGCNISYKRDNNIINELNSFQDISATIIENLISKTRTKIGEVLKNYGNSSSAKWFRTVCNS